MYICMSECIGWEASESLFDLSICSTSEIKIFRSVYIFAAQTKSGIVGITYQVNTPAVHSLV